MHKIPDGASGADGCVKNDAVLLNAPSPIRFTALARAE